MEQQRSSISTRKSATRLLGDGGEEEKEKKTIKKIYVLSEAIIAIMETAVAIAEIGGGSPYYHHDC